MDKIMYFPSKCVINIYVSECINHVIMLLVQYHKRLWVLYLNCTRGYLQFDMLVAIVSISIPLFCIYFKNTYMSTIALSPTL